MSIAQESDYLVVVPRLPRGELFMWADKVAFFLAAGWVAIILALWFAAVMICGDAAGTNLVKTTIVQAVDMGAALVGSAWMAMRLIDLAAKGPARRRGSP
jgi:hypothetical protein